MNPCWESILTSTKLFLEILMLTLHLGGKNANLSLKRKLQGISCLYDLKQMIQSATRITENSKSLIDLVFTNVKEKIIEVRLFDPGLSDHSLVYCILKCGGLCSSQDNRI